MTTASIKRIGVLVAILLSITVSGFAQTSSDTPPAFVTKLLGQLQQDGWSSAASAALANAASRLNWSGTNAADPQVVAVALEYGAHQDTALPPTTQAQVALELALSSVQMEQTGMSRQSAAVAALTAVRSSLSNLQAAIADHTSGNTIGDIIGSAVSSAVRNQVQNSVAPQIGSHSSVGQGLTANGSGSPYGPPSTTPGPPSGTPSGGAGRGAR